MDQTEPSEREARNFLKAVGLLGLLCYNYDRGALDVASLMSNLMAQLVLKKGGRPLFEQMGWPVDRFPIIVSEACDSRGSKELHGTTLASFFMGVSSTGAEMIPVAEWICAFQTQHPQTHVQMTCDEWLDMAAVQTPMGNLSRREIIVFVRDKDGGAHSDTDSRMAKAEHYLEAVNFLPTDRSSIIDVFGTQYDLSNTAPVTLPILRQTAHELLSSIWSVSDVPNQIQPTGLVSVFRGTEFVHAIAPEGYPSVGLVNGSQVQMVKPQVNPGPKAV